MTVLACKKCNTEVQPELNPDIDYPYYCKECDENLYFFEVYEREHTLEELYELKESKRQHFEYAMWKIAEYNRKGGKQK